MRPADRSDARMTGVVKSLWASVQGNPVFMRRVNGWLTVFWIVITPVSIATGWISSVTYVAALSLWALVSGHWSAWQAARVEVNQQHEEEQRDREDVPGEIVERNGGTLQPEAHLTLHLAGAGRALSAMKPPQGPNDPSRWPGR